MIQVEVYEFAVLFIKYSLASIASNQTSKIVKKDLERKKC